MRYSVLATLCLSVVLVLCSTANAGSFEPIWISPTNVNNTYDVANQEISNLLEDYSANKGQWASVPNGAGARADGPLVVMDSKGTLWIMFGDMYTSTDGTYYYLYNVWNYDPKEDKYRYVWGDSSTAKAGAFESGARSTGSLRVPAASNHPGKSTYSAITIDNNDNIWLPSAGYDYAGELWMFNTTSMVFTRMFGLAGDRNADVGTPGQPGETVTPGTSDGPCMVTDSKNNLWLLTGVNSDGFVNAVWHFNTSSFMWTFITGDIVALAGTHNSTFFGGTWMAGCFMDENDRVWLFGGYGNGIDRSDNYASLWTFDTRDKREWELEWGDGTFGALPQSVSADFNADNHPGGAEGCLLVDRMDGTLMLFPSGGYTSGNDYGALNQVWLYSKSLKQWKLLSGDITVYDQEGEYVTYRQTGSTIPAALMYPGRMNGKNQNGDLFIVGGSTYNGREAPGHKDIWIIPNDQCSIPAANKCSVNADCIEELIGYSCACKEGYIGDGFTCETPPVAAPVADAPVATAPTTASPVAASTPTKKTSSASIVGASIVLSLVALVL